MFIHETHSSALDMSGTESPPGGFPPNISSQIKQLNSHPRPTTKHLHPLLVLFSSPSHRMTPLLFPRRALIARSPGPQINHTRLPRSSQSQNIPSPSASHTQKRLSLLYQKKAPSTSTSSNKFIALLRSQNHAKGSSRMQPSAEPTPPPCCQKVGFSSSVQLSIS